MSGWTSAEPDSEDMADATGEPGAGNPGVGRPGRTAATTDGTTTTGTGGVTEDDTEPHATATDVPAPHCAGGPPDEEEPEATGPPDGPTPPCPAIHAPNPTTAPYHRAGIITNTAK